MRHAMVYLTVVACALAMVAGIAVAEEPRGGTLTVAITADPIGFDPHKTTAHSSFQVLENVFDTLVGVGADTLPEPDLAKSWDVSEDGLTWTFHLREGVTFHNGRPLTADDVKYSLDRIMDPDEAAAPAWRMAAVESIEAPDELTVLIHLHYPYPGLLTKVGGYKGMAIVARENVEDGTIVSNPIGSGPFAFVRFVPGDRVELARNEAYWMEDRPILDGIVYRVIPDETVRLTSLTTGEVDWIDGVPPARVDALRGRDDIVVGEAPGLDYWYLGVNLDHEALGDVRVRQAIAFAIDREELAEAALWDAAEANDGPIPPDSFWYTGYHPYLGKESMDKATELLEDAGWAGGFKADIMVSTQYPETIRVAEVMQAQLRPLGIELEIRVLEWGTWLAEQGEGNFDTYFSGWIGNLDADDFFYAQHRTGEGFNFTGYSNPELDELLDRGRMEADEDERYAIYADVQRIIIDEAPYIYVYVPTVVHAWQPYVQGYETRPDRKLRFLNAWLDR